MFICLSVGAGGGGEKYVRIPRHNKSQPIFKMTLCSLCGGIDFNRFHNLQRHMKNEHKSLHTNTTMMQLPSRSLNFQHAFSMMVIGPNGSWKTKWTRKLLLSSLVQSPQERILRCLDTDNPCTKTFSREFSTCR